jgi:hypothetical protein
MTGGISDGNATITISPRPIRDGTTEAGYTRAQYEYIEGALHELVHLSRRQGRFSDVELAKAAARVGLPYRPNDDKSYWNDINKDGLTRDEGSGFFDYMLRKFCPISY